MESELKYYIPNEKDNIGDWTPIKMLKDVKSTYYYNEYFKKGNIYRGSKRDNGPWMYIFGHGAYHYFRDDEIEVLETRLTQEKLNYLRFVKGEQVLSSKEVEDFANKHYKFNRLPLEAMNVMEEFCSDAREFKFVGTEYEEKKLLYESDFTPEALNDKYGILLEKFNTYILDNDLYRKLQSKEEDVTDVIFEFIKANTNFFKYKM